MRKTLRYRATLWWMTFIGAFCFCLCHSSWAAGPSNPQFITEAVRKARKPKPEKGNGETIQDRERRLLRECKGRPNAGACEGYAT